MTDAEKRELEALRSARYVRDRGLAADRSQPVWPTYYTKADEKRLARLEAKESAEVTSTTSTTAPRRQPTTTTTAPPSRRSPAAERPAGAGSGSGWWDRLRDGDGDTPTRAGGAGRSYNSGPPVAAAPVEGEDRRAPIGGMPDDFRAPARPRPGGPVTADTAERVGPTMRPTPIYWTDDEWGPANWSPERIARLQADLAAVGLIGPKENITLGVWDPKSATAYKDLLAYSNSVGLPAEQAIQLYGMGQRVDEFKPDEFIRPDPARLAQDVKSAIRERLRRDPTASELRELMGAAGGFFEEAFRAQSEVSRRAFEAEQSPLLGEGEPAPVAESVDVDPGARFAELIESRFAPEIDRIDRVDEAASNRENLLDNILGLDQHMGV